MKLLIVLTLAALASNPKENPGVDFKRLADQLRATPVFEVAGLKERVKERYGRRDKAEWRRYLAPALKLEVGPRGMVKAADRMESGEPDPTHYDAVWVRDSLWAYLGLSAARSPEAPRVLAFLWDYFASPAQRERARKGEDLHIRFDGNSPTFDDVKVNGVPQKWNHKQNDALGLWLDLTVRAMASGELKDWTPARLEAVAILPSYFERIRYWEMADAGSWEELERVNSSSLGLTISGLERLHGFLGSRGSRKLQRAARGLGVRLDRRYLKTLIDKGYDRLFRQLAAGGESPLHDPKSNQYRTSDAALLNLIYPAKLSRLTVAHKKRILKLVQPLVGEVGIRRYAKDSYQSGNFWFQTVDENKTDDSSSSEDFAERAKGFIEGSEAQWFFDSWYSKCAGMLRLRREQVKFFNRAVSQLTARGRLGADGRPVPAFALPESYNTIVVDKKRYFVPSPITPLNWAKASLQIALEAL